MKLDTIEKHVGKVYDKKAANDENRSTTIWKYISQCRHLQFEEEYNKLLLNKKKLKESGGTITSQFGKMMETNLLSKMIQLSIVFHLLSNGRPMIDYPKNDDISIFYSSAKFSIFSLVFIE